MPAAVSGVVEGQAEASSPLMTGEPDTAPMLVRAWFSGLTVL